MKKVLLINVLLVLILSGCTSGSATFNLETKNFPPNSVITISSAEAPKKYLISNITNGKQNFKINFIKGGYAAIKTETGPKDNEYWFYLGDGDFNGVIDANKPKNYPFIKMPNKQSEEFKAFYELKQSMSNNLMDSLAVAEDEFDKSTRVNVEQKARKFDFWMEKRNSIQLNIIKVFSEKYPESNHTLFLLNQLGEIDRNVVSYTKIFNGLSQEIKESSAGKDMVDQLKRSTRMTPGSMMPNIEGVAISGEPFDKKILKKLNLVIVWTSYNTKSRENTKLLTDLYKELRNKNVEFVGVSLDTKKEWWKNVIRDDKLVWPQFSDLKGAKSPNAQNLSNFNIPYFFIIDEQGRILMNDVDAAFLKDELKKRL